MSSGLFRDNNSGQFAIVKDSSKTRADLGDLNVNTLFAQNSIQLYNPDGNTEIKCDNGKAKSSLTISTGEKVSIKTDRDVSINSLTLHEDGKNVDIGGKPISFLVPIGAPNLEKRIEEENVYIQKVEDRSAKDMKLLEDKLQTCLKEINNLRSGLGSISGGGAPDPLIRHDLEVVKSSVSALTKNFDEYKSSNELINMLKDKEQAQTRDEVKKEIKSEIKNVNTEFGKKIEGITKHLNEVKSEVKNEIKNEVKSNTESVNKQLNEVKNEVKCEIKSNIESMLKQLNEVKNEAKSSIEAIIKQMNEVKSEVKSEIISAKKPEEEGKIVELDKKLENIGKELESVKKEVNDNNTTFGDKVREISKLLSTPASSQKIEQLLIPNGNYSDGWIPIPFNIIPLSDNTIGLRSGVAFTPGMKLFVYQGDEVKYFIVVDVDKSFVTIFGGNKYVLDPRVITKSFYSITKAPLNFDIDPLSWTKTYVVKMKKLEVRKGQFYTIATIKVPIGAWNLSYSAYLHAKKEQTIMTTLSTDEKEETIPNATDIEYGCKFIKLSAKENVHFSLEKKMFLILKSDEDDTLDFSEYDIRLNIISNYL